MNQQLITHEQAKKLARYHQELHIYGRDRAAMKQYIVVCILFAIPMWFLSLWLSGQTGDVNMGTWFSVATFFSFILAAGSTVAGIALFSTRHFMHEPYDVTKEIEHE